MPEYCVRNDIPPKTGVVSAAFATGRLYRADDPPGGVRFRPKADISFATALGNRKAALNISFQGVMATL